MAAKTSAPNRAEAVANVQAAIEACCETLPSAECMSGVRLDEFANDLVRTIGLIAIVRHDECEVASLDEALEDLTQLKIALGFAHQALVDAGVIVPEEKAG